MKIKHGMSYSREYAIWANMKDRCLNPRHRVFASYGGRGITVCERWMSFENFIADMGRRPLGKLTLERLNNDGNYCPENCVWTTHIEQQRNKRSSRIVTIDGETMCLARWVEKVGGNRNVIDARLRKGWSVKAAILTPCIKGRQMKPIAA